MTDFVRYVRLKRPTIYALKGSISPKILPEECMVDSCEVIPEELNTPVCDLLACSNWKKLVHNAFNLPDEADDSAIYPTKMGELFMRVKGSWVMIGTVS